MAVGKTLYKPMGAAVINFAIKNTVFPKLVAIFEDQQLDMLIGLDFTWQFKFENRPLENRVQWPVDDGWQHLEYVDSDQLGKNYSSCNSIATFMSTKEKQILNAGEALNSALLTFSTGIINNVILLNKIKNIEERVSEIPKVEEPTFEQTLNKVLEKETILKEEEVKTLKQFLLKNRLIFNDLPGRTDAVLHHIDTGNHRPIARKPYRESPQKTLKIKEWIGKMINLEIIRESRSPWASPVVLVGKPDGETRFCMDYRCINQITQDDCFPMPDMDGIVQNLQGARYLSSTDMTMGFYQCMMAEEDIPKTAFATSQGLHEFLVMPFGLKGAPSTFNRLVAKVLAPVRGICALSYLDDILIYSSTFEQHLKDIQKVFDLLHKFGLYVKLRKSQFCRLSFKFLGRIIQEGQIMIDQEKIESISSFQRPRTVKQVQIFLGMTGWLRKHVKNFSAIARPLAKLTSGRFPKETFEWTDSCEKAFIDLKAALTRPGTAIVLPDFAKKFIVETDASEHGIAGILLQNDENDLPKVVEYASRQLKKSEINYTITEKECLAIIFSLDKFRAYISEVKFTVVTDHRALIWLMNTKNLNGRLTRWSLRLQEYSFDTVYRPGKKNQLPDALSRATTIVARDSSESETERMISPGELKTTINTVTIDTKLCNMDREEIRTEQLKEAWLVNIMNHIKKGVGNKKDMKKYKNYFLLEDLLFYKNKEQDKSYRLVIPRSLIYQVMREFHDRPSAGHFGREKTKFKVKERVFWHKMEQDIDLYVRTCHICQVTKFQNQSLKNPMQSTFVSAPMQMLALDLLGPYVRSGRQSKFVLVIVDCFSKWVEAFPLRNSSSLVVAKHLHNVICQFGVPEKILSDNGPQFISRVYKELCTLWGIQ